jgi:hypothetical protein
MYSIKQIAEKIFTVVVPNQYDLGMLFCRVQEFYESPNKKFNKNKFSIWDYHKWYSETNSGCFSYAKDWSGFNLPTEVAKSCYKINKRETPYDNIFIEILKKIKIKKSYIIGVTKLNTPTFYHELCHGLYYSDQKYKKEMDSITKSISKANYNKLKNNLKSKGYCSSVLNDEIQAYMATEISYFLTKDIANKKALHKKYKEVFKKHKVCNTSLV